MTLTRHHHPINHAIASTQVGDLIEVTDDQLANWELDNRMVATEWQVIRAIRLMGESDYMGRKIVRMPA